MPALSVLIPYWRRLPQFSVTLESYRHYYPALLANGALELVVIADTPADDELAAVRALLDSFRATGAVVRLEVVDRSAQRFRNPGMLFNLAAALATAPLLGLTNPECAHLGPVFDHALEHARSRRYLVYACGNTAFIPASFEELFCRGNEVAQWYQHTGYSNRLLHFMTVITAADFAAVGGFDPLFDDGLSYEDNDFVERVVAAGLDVLVVDTPRVAHIDHDRGHLLPEGEAINHAHFVARYGRPSIRS